MIDYFDDTRWLEKWQSVQKHQQHDQSTHGSWAGTNQITSEQKKAVQAYTQKIGDVTQWRSVAQNIRDGETPDAPPEFVSSVKTLLNAIDEHSVTPTNAGGKVLLRSGVNWKGKLPAVGEIMSNPVASATWRHNVAEKFATSGDGKPVIIKYGSSTKGLDTSKFGAYLFGDEGEFIVSGKFEVVDRDKENGFTYVSVRPVGDVNKHQQHDQQSHGNWATGNFNEETDYENALMAYSERYGYKISNDKTFTGTTEDEVDSVISYSDFGYVVINKFLRGTSESDLSLFPELKKIVKNRVKNLDKLIEEAPAQFGNTTLYRVFSDKVMNTLQSGDILTDKGFLSTTRLDVTQRDNSEARKWLSDLSSTQDTVGIILPNARKNGKGFAIDMFRTVVDQTSSNSDKEKVVLLPRNM